MKALSKKLYKIAKQKGVVISVAESCTGGMLSSSITSVAGSSEIFDRGFITYSYEAKSDLLDVDSDLIKTKGAVSKDVAEQMAIGALKHSEAQLSVAITGIAGPTGGTKTKPVGLVYFCSNFKGDLINKREIFVGDRNAVRKQAVIFALNMLLNRIC